ncbi:tetratricopeptide repeat protein [Phenylobacterium sp.]|uniref:tetratricopeptide repeat protein n=1 Tax=Phenylobacterium sp. TaxID=1871053 RepID=UPI00260ADB20|nr:tetratricopeptide repeat protein [Phenylobacterium sp.]
MSGAAPGDDLRASAAERIRQGRLTEAEAMLREALRLDPANPRIQVLLGEALLGQGRYEDAWPLMEARLDAPELGSPRPPLAEPEWRGEPLAGKRLLIIGEQGAGDQIMYARFAPIVQAQGAAVTLLCLPSLARLFARSLGVDVAAMAGRVELPDPDCWTLTSSLPARLGVGLAGLPYAAYLNASARPLGRKIGVVTHGNPRHWNDARRSLPPAQTARLLARRDVLDLSPEATGARDFLDTAEIVAGLDLVISVDTAVAHLAGAMGKPVWILLPGYGVDWRWLQGRRDTPWYPSARLWRQTEGDWNAVLERIEAELA